MFLVFVMMEHGVENERSKDKDFATNDDAEGFTQTDCHSFFLPV
jgi:hypothetical protein